MPKRREIKFQDRYGELVGRQNGMKFFIRKDPGLDDTCAPAYWVTIDPGQGKRWVTTRRHQNFHLDGAKEFCQKVAAGEIGLEDMQARYDAEDAANEAAKERAAVREVVEKAKAFRARLGAVGLSYRDLLELEAMAHSLGDMGHNILLGYERGEGWPDGT